MSDSHHTVGLGTGMCPGAWERPGPHSQQRCGKAGCPSVGVAMAQPSHHVCSQTLSNSTSERAGSSHTEETMGGTAWHSPEDCRFLDISSWLALPPCTLQCQKCLIPACPPPSRSPQHTLAITGLSLNRQRQPSRRRRAAPGTSSVDCSSTCCSFLLF